MKTFIKKIINKVRSFTKRMKQRTSAALNAVYIRSKTAVASCAGDGYVDTGIKIIIAVVIGGLILAGLYTLFNTTVIPNMQTKVSNMFSYGG